MYRIIVFKSLVSVGFSIAMISSFIFIIDPIQYFRKASFYKPFYSDALLMSPGIIKNYEYDSLVIGSSMSQNFEIKDLNKFLEGNFIKSTEGGVSAYEISKILEYSNSQNKLKKLVLNIDYFSFSKQFNTVQTNFPEYIYSDNYLDKFKYLYSYDSLVKIAYTLKGNILNQSYGYDFNTCYSWGNNFKYSEEIVLNSFRNDSFDKSFNKTTHNFDNMKIHLDLYVVSNLKPNLEYIYFLPPYSILVFNDALKKGWLEDLLQFRTYLAEIAESNSNIYLYDFQVDIDTITDLNNYKDISHYSPDISKKILKDIRDNNFRIINKDQMIENNKILKNIVQTNQYSYHHR